MATYRVVLDHVATGRKAAYNCVGRAPSPPDALTAVEQKLAEAYGASLTGAQPFGEHSFLDRMISIRPRSVEELDDVALAALENIVAIEDLGAGD